MKNNAAAAVSGHALDDVMISRHFRYKGEHNRKLSGARGISSPSAQSDATIICLLFDDPRA